jgi:hypothetical protein
MCTKSRTLHVLDNIAAYGGEHEILHRNEDWALQKEKDDTAIVRCSAKLSLVRLRIPRLRRLRDSVAQFARAERTPNGCMSEIWNFSCGRAARRNSNSRRTAQVFHVPTREASRWLLYIDVYSSCIGKYCPRHHCAGVLKLYTILVLMSLPGREW